MTDDQTPLPMRVDALGGAMSSEQPSAPDAARPAAPSPTPASVLAAIAAAEGPWFPSRYAAEAGVARDLLDEPLSELRLAGLVRVEEWVRGAGQGYTITPEGKVAVGDPAALVWIKRPAGDPSTAPTAPAPALGAADEEPRDPETRDDELAINPPLVVPVLLVANALWFFVCAVYAIRWGLTPARALSEGHRDVLQRFGAVSGEWLLAGEWWRLLTCCFVHIGALHLIVNMLALAMMGPLAELLWGRGRLVLIYVISGIAGSALAMALRPDTILAGASGAIWGIQMSLFAWLFAFRQHLPPDLANDWFRRLSVVFVLNAGGSFLPNVSWEGHLGGGVAGFVVAGLLNVTRFGDRTRRASAWFLIVLLPVLCVGALAGAMDAKGMPGWQRLRQRLAGAQEARAGAEKREAVRAAEADYRTHAVPRLAELAPDATGRVEQEAVELALRTKRAGPDRVAAVKNKLRPLKAAADAVLRHTPAQPVGSAALDAVAPRARAFAAARARSLDLLLAMVDAPAPAPADQWAAWQAAHREAAALWADWRLR